MAPKTPLYWPIGSSKAPITVIQAFGANPAYYARFLDINGNPYKGHQGIDCMAATGTPVYATHDGNAIYLKDAHGGEGIWIYGNGFATILWHLIGDTDPKYPVPIPFDNRSHAVKAGDLVGYSDNTGAPFESSGPHLHCGLVLLSDVGSIINPGNGEGGCIDPTPYFTGLYASDIPKLVSAYQKLINVLQALLNALGGRN